MFKFWKNKRLLFKWSISYIILLCISIIVNLFAYSIVENRIVDINNKNATEALMHKKNSIDELRDSLIDISYGISQNSYVRNLALNTDKIDKNNRMDFYNLREVAKSYFGMEPYFKDIFIYFNKVDYIVGSQTTADLSQYYDFYYNDKNMTKNEWCSVLSLNHFGDFVDFSSKNEKEGKGNMLFLYSIYGSERFKPYATIAIEVEYSGFFHNDLELFEDCMFVAVDGNKNIVVADENTDVEFAEKFLISNNIKEGINDYGDFVVVAVLSDNDEWLYVDIITKEIFGKSINDSRMIMIIFNILCVGVLSWLAFVLSNNNYRPLRNIVDTLSGHENNIGGEEIQYIIKKVSEILAENSYISQKVQKQDEMLKDMFLLKLLTNSSLPKNKEEIFKELEIFFPYENYICVLFSIKLNDDMFFDNKNDDADISYQLAKVVLTNILDEKLKKICFMHYCYVDNILCMVANTSDKENREVIFNTISELRDVVLRNFNIKFVAGISQVHEKCDNISLCYNEAKLCVDYRLVGRSNVIKYESVDYSEIDGYYFPHAQEDQLIRMIKFCDIDGVIILLNEIFDKNFTERKISAKQTGLFLSALISVIEENCSLDKKEIADMYQMAKSVEDGKTAVLSVKRKIYNAVVDICNDTDNKKISRIEDNVEKIKNYIKENYKDPDLNVNTVAQKFHITSSYISTIFKKNANMGLQEYITSVRMEHAKNILSITNYTIDKTAVMVGYVNSRSFSRAFTKYVGISPGKFKELN